MTTGAPPAKRSTPPCGHVTTGAPPAKSTPLEQTRSRHMSAMVPCCNTQVLLRGATNTLCHSACCGPRAAPMPARYWPRVLAHEQPLAVQRASRSRAPASYRDRHGAVQRRRRHGQHAHGPRHILDRRFRNACLLLSDSDIATQPTSQCRTCRTTGHSPGLYTHRTAHTAPGMVCTLTLTYAGVTVGRCSTYKNACKPAGLQAWVAAAPHLVGHR